MQQEMGQFEGEELMNKTKQQQSSGDREREKHYNNKVNAQGDNDCHEKIIEVEGEREHQGDHQKDQFRDPATKNIKRIINIGDPLNSLRKSLSTNTSQLLYNLEGREKVIEVEERDRDQEVKELKQRKNMAEEANKRLSTKLNVLKESLAKTCHELESKTKKIEDMKLQLENKRAFEIDLIEKDALLNKFKEDFIVVRYSESYANALLTEAERQIRELESWLEMSKESESTLMDSLVTQTKHLEQAKISLEESKLEVVCLHEKVEKLKGSSSSSNKGSVQNVKSIESQSDHLMKELIKHLKTELESAKQDEKIANSKAESLKKEMSSLKNELKSSTDAEENNKHALDSLASALKEVATEAKQSKEKLNAYEEELKYEKEEIENLKAKLKNTEEKSSALLDETRKEADLYKCKADRLRLEAEESLVAWNGKETVFVDCIKRVEEERYITQQENRRLLDLLRAVELKHMTSREENQKLRDILKQALNEANVAKEAAAIAKAENSQLKDSMVEKEQALIFLSNENENLRINEVVAHENIKGLQRLLLEASSASSPSSTALPTKEINHNPKKSSPKAVDNPKPENHVKKYSGMFSFNLKELFSSAEKHEEVISEEGGDQIEEALKGSIFDEVDSPDSVSHQRNKSSVFLEDASTDHSMSSEDFENLDGNHADDSNSRKKKALLRRFSDLLVRKKSIPSSS